LDKALFQQLLTGKWMRDKRNLIITGPVVSARPGWHVRWHNQPAETVIQFYTDACHDCLMSWNWLMGMDASPASSKVSSKPTF